MVKQLKLNIHTDEKIVNKKIKEEFTLKNATIYGGYNIFWRLSFQQWPRSFYRTGARDLLLLQ